MYIEGHKRATKRVLFHVILLGNVYSILYMRKRRSKFELSDYAHCKIPKSQYSALKEFTDNTNIHWAECARMILDRWIKTGAILDKVNE